MESIRRFFFLDTMLIRRIDHFSDFQQHALMVYLNVNTPLNFQIIVSLITSKS